MKRGAERQIYKGEDEPEIEEVSGDGSFQKADDAALANRKIKAMPRRLGGSASFTASPSEPATNGAAERAGTPPLGKFSSFSGFGTPGSSGSAFSFVPPSSSPSFPPAKPTSSPFGPSPGTPTPSSGLFSSGAPPVASTASNAAKTFASFLGDSPSKAPTSSAPPPPLPKSTSASAAESSKGDEPALKYYRSLRGLNVSILAAITKAIDEDPFADVATLLARYNSLRADVQKEYDDRSKSNVPPARSSAPSPSPFRGPPANSTPTPSPFKMPAPPPSFAGFGKPAGSAPPKTNGVSDPTPAPAPPAPAPPAPAPALTPPANPFSFPSSSTSTSTTPKPSPFAPTGSPFGSSSSTSAFGSAPSTSLFGSGAGSTTTASPFGSPSPFSKPTSSSSLFGGASGSAFGSSSGSPSPSLFGARGSIGNPVGFSFASPKAEGSAAEEKKGEAADGDGNAEAGSSQEIGSSQETEKASTTDEGSSGQGSGSTGMLFGNDTPTGLDAEGEGEEDEETVKTERLRAFRLKKAEEPGDGGWLDIGVGFLRLKKHKETSARRLLLRNSNSGKIQINFALYPGLKVSQSKKSLTFVGHDLTGEPQTYSLRFRTEEVAKEFQAALDNEIAQIKASS
ncbi:hypothetical protein C8R47DRAFT_284869 [Mycena vitilis]|nr:hypothetical protein C8R47DRAFT_284869 [Mycena vitilis]